MDNCIVCNNDLTDSKAFVMTKKGKVCFACKDKNIGVGGGTEVMKREEDVPRPAESAASLSVARQRAGAGKRGGAGGGVVA